MNLAQAELDSVTVKHVAGEGAISSPLMELGLVPVRASEVIGVATGSGIRWTASARRQHLDSAVLKRGVVAATRRSDELTPPLGSRSEARAFATRSFARSAP